MRERHKRANDLFKDEKLRLMHYAVAAYIAEYAGVNQKTLSSILLMEPKDLGVIVRELAAAGYAVRAPSSTDKRQYELTITADGQEWLTVFDKHAHALDEMFLAPLEPRQRKIWSELLNTLTSGKG
jgi:DNA-binding MarR family transcriptional regulator